MIVLTFRRVHIKYSTKQKAVFRRYCDTYTSFGRKPQLSSTISSFPSLNLQLLTNRRRYSSHLLPAVCGWLRLYWWWSSGKDASRRDAIRHTTELSRDNYLRDAASDVSVCGEEGVGVTVWSLGCRGSESPQIWPGDSFNQGSWLPPPRTLSTHSSWQSARSLNSALNCLALTPYPASRRLPTFPPF